MGFIEAFFALATGRLGIALPPSTAPLFSLVISYKKKHIIYNIYTCYII